ncbi:hypothetical protein V6N11_055917 [Hibiscus sabdariffa]|uniref:Uncharacterized protein n=1 Tax=Hibiscus sabdariffa TaxID=183260 RepID=A0ABR2T2K7_9ROSI
MNDVVWIKIPMEATGALGFTKSPHHTVINSYHHHSKQTETQLGSASLSSGFQPVKHSKLGFSHVGSCTLGNQGDKKEEVGDGSGSSHGGDAEVEMGDK